MKKARYVRYWLWTGAVLIFLMVVVVGGITRLTGSGLSMSELEPDNGRMASDE